MRAAGWVVCLAAMACDRDADPVPTPPTSSAVRPTLVTPPVAALSGSASAGPAAVLRDPTQTCRAVSVRGEARRNDGTPVVVHGRLDDSPWLDLGDAAVLTVKHARTAREITFEGPGRVLPCYGATETFLVASGRARATAGAGARPGGEVIIATPRALVRFADATLSLDVSADRLELDVRVGRAWLDAPGEEPLEVPAGGARQARGSAPDVKGSVQLCEQEAKRAADAEQAVRDRSAKGATLAERATAHYRARRAARKACGIAAATLGTTPPSGGSVALEARLTAAETLWLGPGSAKDRDKSTNNANFR